MIMKKSLYPLSRVSIGCRVVGDAPCLGERYPLEGVKPQMLKQICSASLGRAEFSPDLFLGEITRCLDLVGTHLPVLFGVSAVTAWLG